MRFTKNLKDSDFERISFDKIRKNWSYEGNG